MSKLIKEKVKKIPQHLTDCFIPTKTNSYKPYTLRHKALSTYSAILIFIKVAVSVLFIFYPNLAYLSDVTPDKLIGLTNQARQAQGLNPLIVNSKLTAAAKNKAQDMLEKDYFAHTSPEGATPWKWIKGTGYSYIYAGENLAMDFVSAQSVHNAWMASGTHKANILNPNYQEIGIAVLQGEFQEKSTCLVVQTFGATSFQVTAPKPAKTVSPSPLPDVQPSSPAQPPQEEIPTTEIAPPSIDTIPPESPQIVYPKKDSFVTTSTPIILGKAEPGSTIIIIINDKEIDKTKTSNEGNFSYAISKITPLKDGSYELKTKAQDAAGNASESSEVCKFTIDTQPPVIDIANSYVAFDKEKKQLDIFAYVQEDPEKVLALSSTDQIELNNNFGLWTGSLKIKDGLPPSVKIKALDAAGNIIEIPLPTQGKIQSAFIGPALESAQSLSLKANQISKKIYLGVLALLFCALVLNILIKIKIQHPSTIIFSLLLCGMTILLLLI